MTAKHPALRVACALMACAAAPTASAFTAEIASADVVNQDLNGNHLADVGDGFSVADGRFSSYLAGFGDPLIPDADLASYRFNLSGTVTDVTGSLVTYGGLYELYFDGDGSGSFSNTPGSADFSFSSGLFGLTVDFGLSSPFSTTAWLQQTAGPAAGFPGSGFSNSTAMFHGFYAPTPGNPDTGSFRGTVQSVPDGGNSAILLGLAVVGTLVARWKFAS